jgi:hypothetical protein
MEGAHADGPLTPPATQVATTAQLERHMVRRRRQGAARAPGNH